MKCQNPKCKSKVRLRTAKTFDGPRAVTRKKL